VISARGEFLGGAFTPGIEISFDALAERAAQLRKVEAVKPRSVIGRNTVECLQAGMYFGYAGLVDRIVDRMTEELGEVKAVIATGGLASLVLDECRTITHHEPMITPIGLRMIFERNVQ
jgi:type III pantothenate kinase